MKAIITNLASHSPVTIVEANGNLALVMPGEARRLDIHEIKGPARSGRLYSNRT